MQNTCVFDILTCKCAWRHSGVPFFHHFSTSERPKVVRIPQLFDILTLKCASRHSGAQFLTSQLQKTVCPRRCFVLLATAACNCSCLLSTDTSAPAALPRILFDPAHPQITEKHSISRMWILFLLTFAQLYLLSSDSTSLLCCVIF